MTQQQETVKTATFVKNLNGSGVGKVYRVDPPMSLSWGGSDSDDGRTTEYVWVSAASTYSGPETYIFPSDADGNVTGWGELRGSYRGGLDHEHALNRAGYEVSS